MRQSTKVVTIRNIVLFLVNLGVFIYNVYWDNYYIDWDEAWLSGSVYVVLICPILFACSIISLVYTIKERDYSRRDNWFIAINAVCSALAVVLELYYIFVCMW